jgi:hypothetical protein
MYVRATTRKNKDGSAVRYLQLAHNEWDAASGTSRPQVLHSFGREDQLDRAAVERLVASLTRLLDPAAALRATSGSELTFLASRPMGGAHALDGLWHRIGIDAVMKKLLKGRRLDPAAERVLFALVANRALAPSSKLAATRWVEHDSHIPGLPATSDDACYRAMDWLLSIEDKLAEEVYWQVADLLNLEVDLLFFDTTSTYFETGEPDLPAARDDHGRRLDEQPDHDQQLSDPANTETSGDGGGGEENVKSFRAYGKSKDHRPDLPQVVIGMAVTRTGIPIRVWSWPGNTGDQALIRQVREDLREWKLTRVVWVADRGFASEKNRRFLQRAGGHYILGEKIRSGSPAAQAALSRQGRYAHVADNMQVKQVQLDDTTDRFVICHNPDQATRDAAIRAELIARLEEEIADSDKLTATKRAELRGRLSTKPGLNRFLRATPKGLLRLDKAAIKAEERLDGKFLLRCSDPHLSPEDIATGYKQLLEVERGWRDMKTIIDLRPVYHRKEDRIRAHVLLCWLALLLIRIAETTCEDTWLNLREELERLHVGTFAGPAGTFRQRTQTSPAQRAILAKLGITEPKRIITLEPGTAV